jgi:hypothetical protein
MVRLILRYKHICTYILSKACIAASVQPRFRWLGAEGRGPYPPGLELGQEIRRFPEPKVSHRRFPEIFRMVGQIPGFFPKRGLFPRLESCPRRRQNSEFDFSQRNAANAELVADRPTQRQPGLPHASNGTVTEGRRTTRPNSSQVLGGEGRRIFGVFTWPRNPRGWHLDAARGTQSQFVEAFSTPKLERRPS